MAQQRVHPATLVKLKKLQALTNKVREKEGLKKLSVPDLIEEITNHFIQETNHHFTQERSKIIQKRSKK